MKTAHIMAGAPTGGAELFYERLTTALGADEPVLPIIRANPARAARLGDAGLHPVQLPFRGLLDLRTRPAIGRALHAFRPDLVMAWMGRAAAATPPGDYVLTGRLGGYYDLRRFRACTHLVANTEGLVTWITAQGWPGARVHHLTNFTPDLAGAAPATLAIDAPIILALGRLHPNKGFDTLIRALPHVQDAHIVIAGEGPERQRLDHLARSLNVHGRTHLLGWRTDQAALLAAATVVAVPSRQEPLGNTILEAFSARTPVVASNSAGPAELIRHGETGLLVPPDDPQALAAALDDLLRNATRARTLATNARIEYETRHAPAPVLARWRAVLTHLVETR